jgi:hypothetical protein
MIKLIGKMQLNKNYLGKLRPIIFYLLLFYLLAVSYFYISLVSDKKTKLENEI